MIYITSIAKLFMYIVIQCVNSEGKKRTSNIPVLSSDPDADMIKLNSLHPGCVHTWREANPEEIRKKMLQEMLH
jgi:uncharacterized protein YxeA